MAAKPSSNGHVPINGLSLYHEVHGELATSTTPPLLLIPGAFMATDSMKSWVSAFADERAVIVFDQQGHGRTPDTSRKMSYEQFGDDAAALLRALKVDRADVMGYSQGGGVALQLALRHPTLVNKLVSMSATYRKDGWYPSVMEGIEGLSASAFAGTPVEERRVGCRPRGMRRHRRRRGPTPAGRPADAVYSGGAPLLGLVSPPRPLAGATLGTTPGTRTRRNRVEPDGLQRTQPQVTDTREGAGPNRETMDIFEGTEQIQQLVISRAISGLRIE